jgi:hypothetical protein
VRPQLLRHALIRHAASHAACPAARLPQLVVLAVLQSAGIWACAALACSLQTPLLLLLLLLLLLCHPAWHFCRCLRYRSASSHLLGSSLYRPCVACRGHLKRIVSPHLAVEILGSCSPSPGISHSTSCTLAQPVQGSRRHMSH